MRAAVSRNWPQDRRAPRPRLDEGARGRAACQTTAPSPGVVTWLHAAGCQGCHKQGPHGRSAASAASRGISEQDNSASRSRRLLGRCCSLRSPLTALRAAAGTGLPARFGRRTFVLWTAGGREQLSKAVGLILASRSEGRYQRHMRPFRHADLADAEPSATGTAPLRDALPWQAATGCRRRSPCAPTRDHDEEGQAQHSGCRYRNSPHRHLYPGDPLPRSPRC